MTRRRARLLYMMAAIAGFSLLTGCGKSGEGVKLAKKFGQTADEFKEKTDKLANDIYFSCLRRARYIDLVAVPGQDADQERMRALQSCEALNKPTAARAVLANGVVTSYIKAVGHLAGDENVTFQTDFTTVEKSLNGLVQTGLRFVIPQEAVSQGVRIANSVFEWGAKRFQSVELSKAVICTKEPLTAYTTGLADAYDRGYINGILANEEETVRRYYNGITANQTGSFRNTPKAMRVKDYEALNSNSYDSLMAVRNNRAAAASHIKIRWRPLERCKSPGTPTPATPG